MHPSRNDIGAYIAAQSAFLPQSLAASGTANGAGVDRINASSAVLYAQAGAATGGPSAVSVTFQLQDSADNSTFANVTSETSLITLSAASTGAELDIDLTGLRQYVRVVGTAALTGGSSPTIPVSAVLVLGGQANLPA